MQWQSELESLRVYIRVYSFSNPSVSSRTSKHSVNGNYSEIPFDLEAQPSSSAARTFETDDIVRADDDVRDDDILDMRTQRFVYHRMPLDCSKIFP